MTAPREPGGTPARAVGEAAVVVDARGLRKTYAGREVLHGVDLVVRRGEFLGVLGPNGAGKTTLVEIVAGLRRPDGGTVTVLGGSPLARDPDRQGRIGVQTQRAGFFPRLTAREYLRTMASLYRVAPERADRTLAVVGLTGHDGVRVDRLSGGQRQRLAIAAALVHDPDVLVLDEPTGGLDPEGRRDLWAVLRELRTRGRTIICTTHHLDEADALCDRVAILVDGEIRALDTPFRLKAAGSGTAKVLVPADRVPAGALAGLAGVVGVHEHGGAVVLETRSPSDVLLQVSEVCGLAGVETRTPSLEDVYLELTGGPDRTRPGPRVVGTGRSGR